MNEPDLFQFGSKEQHYFPMWGTTELREALASCLTRHLAPDLPVLPENVSSIDKVMIYELRMFTLYLIRPFCFKMKLHRNGLNHFSGFGGKWWSSSYGNFSLLLVRSRRCSSNSKSLLYKNLCQFQ